MLGFTGLTEQICREAFDTFVLPAIESGYSAGGINKLAGNLVVLDPSYPYDPKYRHAVSDDRLVKSLILFEVAINDGESDIEKYIKISRSKAVISYLTGLPSHQVQQTHPELYVPGMTKWGGSAVSGVGPMRLVVAFSGVQWYFDQMISEMMISAIQALCHHGMVNVMASEVAFIPSP